MLSITGKLEGHAPSWPPRPCQCALLGKPAVARGGRGRSASLQLSLQHMHRAHCRTQESTMCGRIFRLAWTQSASDTF